MKSLLFNDFDKSKIIELLQNNNIPEENNYLIVTKNRSIKEGLIKLLINSTYNAIDASLQYLLVFTSDAIYEARISGEVLDFLKRGEISFNKYKHNEISDFNIEKKMTKHIISWKAGGKIYSYEVDKFQGIYGFVKENFNYLQENNFFRKT
ncbi:MULTISPECIES: hypothetical protein [unclassified Gemella]|uniref:hypothetical protein n=1 Tax=unclassified Gemella TaxID=2624949 RepID=UPI001C03B518|nr:MULTISPECIES: hypothetical protein [unclassified Gemella]MBU0278666.1 hypothetical protein [Gemella sp. zg-1178]QWQ39221.1 hypothetical protein KMP11_02515 [Gemella sp. zg-570]